MAYDNYSILDASTLSTQIRCIKYLFFLTGHSELLRLLGVAGMIFYVPGTTTWRKVASSSPSATPLHPTGISDQFLTEQITVFPSVYLITTGGHPLLMYTRWMSYKPT